MTRCDFRTHRECLCPPSECRVQEREYPPVVLPSWKTQAVTCLFLGFVAAIVSAAVMETRLKTVDLQHQEQVTTWKK